MPFSYKFYYTRLFLKLPFLNIYCQYYIGSWCSTGFVCIVVVVAVGPNPPASSQLVAIARPTMPSLKLVTNFICTVLASCLFCRVQNALLLCSGRHQKTEALRQNHQDKLSLHNVPSVGKKDLSSLKLKLLVRSKWQKHVPVNGTMVKGRDLWVSFLRITLPITTIVEENICFH